MTTRQEFLHAIRGTRPLLETVVGDRALPMDMRAWAATALKSYPTDAELEAELNAHRLELGHERVNAWGDALMYARWVLEALMTLSKGHPLREKAVWAERHFPASWELPKRPLIQEPDRQWFATFMGELGVDEVSRLDEPGTESAQHEPKESS